MQWIAALFAQHRSHEGHATAVRTSSVMGMGWSGGALRVYRTLLGCITILLVAGGTVAEDVFVNVTDSACLVMSFTSFRGSES